MTPGNMPLRLYRGDTYSWQFALFSDPAATVPVDLTGIAVLSEIRNQPAGSLICIFNNTIILPNIINMVLTAANSELLVATGGAWDLRLFYPNNLVATILAGPVSVIMDVTNSAPPTQPVVASQDISASQAVVQPVLRRVA
jgi:hypothetical protein